MKSPRVRRALIAAGFAVLLAGSVAYAQRIWVGGGGGWARPRFAEVEDFDGRFLYCRGFFNGPGGRRGGWTTDYPGADNNFSVRLAELTLVDVRVEPDRQPRHVVVRLDDPVLNRCPMLFMENVGTIDFSETEAAALRLYLQKGGFLWVDDFWGSAAWEQWAEEIAEVLPRSEYPIFDIPLTHPIMHALYDIDEFLQVSAINFWYWSGGSVSERGRDSDEVHYRGIQDAKGRLMVLITHNTDVADTWEREGENREYFARFSPKGYAFGVNVVLYALTH